MFFSFLTTFYLSDKEGHCPLRNSVSKCIPRCVSDYQCSFNEKCCPNKCGSESVQASPINTGNGYKGSNGKKNTFFSIYLFKILFWGYFLEYIIKFIF